MAAEGGAEGGAGGGAEGAGDFSVAVVDGCDHSAALEVRFGEHVVRNGETLTPRAVHDQPVVSWRAASPSTLYTIAFVDPDAPNPADPKFACWAHWLVVNVPGGSQAPAEGYEAFAFVPSAPGSTGGVHRYFFVVLEQARRLEEAEVGEHVPVHAGFAPRRSFSLRARAAALGLRAVGAVHYLAEYDDSVPAVHARINPAPSA